MPRERRVVSYEGRHVVPHITPEDEERVKDKVVKGFDYATELICKEFGLFPFKHPLKGLNFSLVDNDREVKEGCGYKHFQVVLYMSRHFDVFNRGGYTQAFQASISIMVKGKIDNKVMHAQKLFGSFVDGEENPDNDFQYSRGTHTEAIEIMIRNEAGLDELVAGRLDERLLVVLRAAHVVYVGR